MQTTKKLIGLAKQGKERKLGNHEVTLNGDVVKFWYFDTAIAIVNHTEQTITFENGGWNTPSTNRAINSYRFELGIEHPNYTMIDNR